MKTAAIIQARMESTRLPGKILLPLAGEMALVRVIERVAQAHLMDEIIVACPDTSPNQVLRTIQMRYVSDSLLATNFRIFAGPMHNVIRRVLMAAMHYHVDVIADITADCPLVDPCHIDLLVEEVTANKADYASNIHPRTWPDGFDVQVYRTDLLHNAYQEMIDLPKIKRYYHTGWNIIHHQAQIEERLKRPLSVRNHAAAGLFDWPALGLTLDTAEDFEVLCHVHDHFYRQPRFTAEEVIGWLRDNPHLVTNSDVIRKEPEEG